MEDGLYYIYAYFNPFWIYYGWWLYGAPIRVEELAEWHVTYIWLNYSWRLDALMEGLSLPVLRDYRGSNSSQYINSFFEKYPAGVVCEVKDGGRYFTVVESDYIGKYSKYVREAQLKAFAEAQEKKEKAEAQQN